MADCCEALKKELAALRAEIAKIKPVNEAKIIREAANRALIEIQPQLSFKADKNYVQDLQNRLNQLIAENNKLRRDLDNIRRNPQNNSALERRVSRLESYCNSLESFIGQISKSLEPFITNIIGFFDFFSFIFK
ncbi:hypothetical protein IQ243_28005 [Nostocales cyanobacterium LEGE 11386]|nr:hypothetical protein [Nostocales cyanobacterium LEGE 11386]